MSLDFFGGGGERGQENQDKFPVILKCQGSQHTGTQPAIQLKSKARDDAEEFCPMGFIGMGDIMY